MFTIKPESVFTITGIRTYAILSDDMHLMHVLSIEEAQDWIQKSPSGYTGHQRAEVRRAIEYELSLLDSFTAY